MAFVLAFIFSAQIFAFEFTNFYFTAEAHQTDLSHVLSKVGEGDVVVVGEHHGFYPHHQVQMEVIDGLMKLGFTVDVGIEHIPYTNQGALDEYLKGAIDDGEFLSRIGWTINDITCVEYAEALAFENPFASMPFDCYKGLLKAPLKGLGHSYAINLSRDITGKVSQGGLEALSKEELTLLPPDFEKGNVEYFERFKAAINGSSEGHGSISEESLALWFLAHSLWDDTMAWQSLKVLQSRPKNVMVIVVGDFHVAYAGGLPDRLKARGARNIHYISQLDVESKDLAVIESLAQPHSQWGERSHLTVVTSWAR